MRKNFGAKAILYPMPVLIIGTYDEDGKPNAMNAAWGGISEETQISICVDERILDENGKIDLEKFSPITYDPVNHTYRWIGDIVGKAFSDGLKLK